MAENRITIRHTIVIAKPKELVWDYTQDYDKRAIWDSSVVETTLLQTTPNRIVRLKMRGNTAMTFIYKHDERPHKTSLTTKEIISPVIINAGGSWVYEDQNGETRWTQTNTIVFKQHPILKLILPLLKIVLERLTIKATQKAKQEIEKL